MSRERMVAVDDGLLTDVTTAYEAAATARLLLAKGIDRDRLDAVLEIAERRARCLVDRLHGVIDLRAEVPDLTTRAGR